MTTPAHARRAIAWPLATLAAGAALSIPPLRSLIEQSMAWHMLVQMPLLVLGGWLSMRCLAALGSVGTLERWNRYGLTGFIAAQAILAFWMLPLSIDRAVVLPWFDLLKVASLFACGAMLRHSFERSPALIQVFFVGYAVPMMFSLGAYFAATDLRLCNAYSLESQMVSGQGLAILATLLGALWLVGTIRKLQASSRRFC